MKELVCSRWLMIQRRARFSIDSLKEAKTQDMSQEQAAAYNIVVGILQKKDATAGNLASAVAKLAVAEAKGQVMDKVKEEISSQVAEKLGLSSFDPTGLLSAVELIRAIGKGDLDAIAQNVAVIIGAKLLLAVVCTVHHHVTELQKQR